MAPNGNDHTCRGSRAISMLLVVGLIQSSSAAFVLTTSSHNDVNKNGNGLHTQYFQGATSSSFLHQTPHHFVDFESSRNVFEEGRNARIRNKRINRKKDFTRHLFGAVLAGSILLLGEEPALAEESTASTMETTATQVLHLQSSSTLSASLTPTQQVAEIMFGQGTREALGLTTQAEKDAKIAEYDAKFDQDFAQRNQEYAEKLRRKKEQNRQALEQEKDLVQERVLQPYVGSGSVATDRGESLWPNADLVTRGSGLFPQDASFAKSNDASVTKQKKTAAASGGVASDGPSLRSSKAEPTISPTGASDGPSTTTTTWDI